MSKKSKDEAAEYFRRDAAKQGMSLKDYCDKYGIDYWELLGKKRPEVSIHQTQVT
jgi:hypothetical protein